MSIPQANEFYTIGCIVSSALTYLILPSHLIRKQNAMTVNTPKPPTSASCSFKMILLPGLSIPCLYSTLVLSQLLKSFRLLLFVTVWGNCLNAGSLELWNPLADEEGSLQSGNADSRGHIASGVVSRRAENYTWRLHLCATGAEPVQL